MHKGKPLCTVLSKSTCILTSLRQACVMMGKHPPYLHELIGGPRATEAGMQSHGGS